MSKICVVIVTYNSENHIYDCLESIFKHNDIGDELEVLVVDNCSSRCEEMERHIKMQYGNRVIVIKNKKNLGYGHGNNIGIKNSHAPIVMIMNPDVRLVMPVFRRAYEEFQKNEKCALLGMKQIIPGERGRSFSWSFRSSFWLGQLLYPFCVYFDVYLQEYMTIHGACFMVRKQIFEKYGLFDENIFMYGEEADIHWRMKIIGKNDFLYKKQLSYIHLHKSNEMRSYCMKNLILGLDSKLYLNKRDSLDESLVINMEILQTKLILLRMKIKSLLGYKNDKYYNATVEWLDYLKKIKCKY